MTKRRRQKIGGYAWNRHIQQAHAANTTAREALTAIHQHIASSPTLSPILVSQLIAEAALALAENQQALRELQQIAKTAQEKDDE